MIGDYKENGLRVFLKNININLCFSIIIIIYSIIVFLGGTLSVECDSNTYMNFAQSLFNHEPVNLLRGPGYPLFLIATGFVLPGTLIFTLLAQVLMGVLSAFVILKLFKNERKAIQLIVFLLIVTTGFNFTGQKILLAEHFLMFILTISMYFFFKYLESNSIVFFFRAVSLSTLAFLTRFESAGLLISILIVSFFHYFKQRIKLRQLTIILLIPILSLSTWSLLRSTLNNDPKLFGTITNEGGSQLLWSNHMAQARLTGDSIAVRKIFGGDNNTENTSCSVPNSEECRKNFFDLAQQSKTTQVVNLLKKELKLNPSIYKDKVVSLSRDESYADELSRIWLPIQNQPEKIVDLYFGNDQKLRSTQAILLFQSILVNKSGAAESDKLLRAVALESFVKHPELIKSYFGTFFSHFGFNTDSNSFIKPAFTSGIDYFVIPFNVVNCARYALNDDQFAEYSFFYPQVIKLEIDNLLSFNRYIYRFVLGFCLLFFLFLIFDRSKQNKEFDIVLLFTLVFIYLTFTIGMVGPGSKYDIVPGGIGIVLIGRTFAYFSHKFYKVRGVN